MDQKHILFEGLLTEMPSEAPRCGDIKVAVAYRFSVERLISGTLEQKNAVVLVPCPEFHGDGFFAMKSRYLIEASADLEEGQSYTIYNDYRDRPTFWLVNITKL